MQEQGVSVGSSESKKLAAFNIIERKGFDKAIWSRVGTAFYNRDGSINLHLDSFPIGGKVHLREDKYPEGSKRRDSHAAPAELDAEA